MESTASLTPAQSMAEKALLSEIREHNHDAIVFVLGHAWHRVSEVVEEIRNDEVLFKDNLIHRCLQLYGPSRPRLRASLQQILMLKHFARRRCDAAE
jgi:hypothetical protein